MHSFNDMTAAMVRATMNLVSQAEQRKTQAKPLYTYSHGGTTFHFSRMPTAVETAIRAALFEDLLVAETDEQKRELLGSMHKLPIKKVDVKRAQIIDRSRYTGERLREIRKAGGGAREQAKAAARAAKAAA